MPFDLYKVTDSEDWPRDYMQLTYEGKEGTSAVEFAPEELEDLKWAIKSWEAQYYAD